MKKKRIIIFTSKQKAKIANSLKKQLLLSKVDYLIIIVDVDELYTSVLPDYISRILKIEINMNRRNQSRQNKKVETNCDEKGNFDLVVRNTVSYNRMENIFLRYNPEYVILTSIDGLAEATAIRDKHMNKTKVILYSQELFFNHQLLNPYVDYFLVSNEQDKSFLISEKVKESKILRGGVAYPIEYDEIIGRSAANKELGLVNKLRTMLVIIEEDDNIIYYKTLFLSLKKFQEKYNIIIWVNNNEGACKDALLSGFQVFTDDTAKFQTLLSACNFIIAHPSSYILTIAFRREKLFVATNPTSQISKKLLDMYDDKIVAANTFIRVENFLTLYPNEGYEEKRMKTLDFDYVNPAESLLKLLDLQ